MTCGVDRRGDTSYSAMSVAAATAVMLNAHQLRMGSLCI